MKKAIFFLIIFSITLSVTAYSQKARVGISGGVTISNMNSNINGKKETGNSLTGLMASMIIETPITGHISFQPAIAYVRKGMELKSSVANPTADTSLQLRYVDLPLNFIYMIGKKAKFYFGGGPCLSFSLPSHRKVVTGETKSTTELSFGTEATDTFKGFDYGVNGLAGLRLANGFYLTVNYTQGLRNLMPMPVGDNSIHNNYAGIQLGYLFKNESK